MITADLLRGIMPGCPHPDIYAPPLDAALTKWEINTRLRIAACLAECAHETGELVYWTELSDGSAYEGDVVRLGNTQPGDGPRYKGRGPTMLTGRTNYAACGEALGVDLLEHPEKLLEADVGFQSLGWFWRVGAGRNLHPRAQELIGIGVDLNDLADRGALRGCTLAVQGNFLDGHPTHHLKRARYYDRGLRVLKGVLL